MSLNEPNHKFDSFGLLPRMATFQRAVLHLRRSKELHIAGSPSWSNREHRSEISAVILMVPDRPIWRTFPHYKKSNRVILIARNGVERCWL